MSPSLGLATTHQLTDQARWEEMLETLVRKMPGAWKRLDEDVKDDLQVRLLEATEVFNFGNDPGVFCGNFYWACVEHTEEDARRSLKERRDRRDARGKALIEQLGKLPERWADSDFQTNELEQEIQIWDSLPANVKVQVTDRIQNSKRLYFRPPSALELLIGERPRLPRYARHFRSMQSKNVDFFPIIRIMGEFFDDAIYYTGCEGEGGLEEGVKLSFDGSGPGFYASLCEKVGPAAATVQQVGEDSALFGSSSTAMVEGSRVQLRGLRARPDLNGRAGTALRYVEAKGRWEVVLDGEGVTDSLAVKVDNLKALLQEDFSPDDEVVTRTGLPDRDVM